VSLRAAGIEAFGGAVALLDLPEPPPVGDGETRWARSSTAVVWRRSPARPLPRDRGSTWPTSTSVPTETSYA
jgi:hypothetical protein